MTPAHEREPLYDVPPYDDPLRARSPRGGSGYPPTYWQATAGNAPEDDGRLPGDIETDVAIVGAGYTGLACAHFLASRYGLRPLVLEAHRPAWGCSGRNGSFARPAVGRLPYSDWVRRWGETKARRVFAEGLRALETVRALLSESGIDCDAMPDGWLKLAHRPRHVRKLEHEQTLLRDTFGFEVQLLDAKALAEHHVRGGEAYGAIRWPVSFAMHPLKLGFGLVRTARHAGATVYSSTPVLEIVGSDGRHELRTPWGRVRARQVVIATNGYTVERAFPFLKGRLLPVLSNIVVTRPMTDEEVAAGNFVTTDAMSDTRKMLYYYRRLPDNRIMLGGKGPLRQTPENMEAHKQQLLSVIRTKFPFVNEPTADYFWGGWVALTYDSMPHVANAADDGTMHYALGYMGSGVSMSIHAGRRIAERIGEGRDDLPDTLSVELPRFPAAAFRRLGQRLMMRWFAVQDEWG